jgi:hypothetical protein
MTKTLHMIVVKAGNRSGLMNRLKNDGILEFFPKAQFQVIELNGAALGKQLDDASQVYVEADLKFRLEERLFGSNPYFFKNLGELREQIREGVEKASFKQRPSWLTRLINLFL